MRAGHASIASQKRGCSQLTITQTGSNGGSGFPIQKVKECGASHPHGFPNGEGT